MNKPNLKVGEINWRNENEYGVSQELYMELKGLTEEEGVWSTAQCLGEWVSENFWRTAREKYQPTH